MQPSDRHVRHVRRLPAVAAAILAFAMLVAAAPTDAGQSDEPRDAAADRRQEVIDFWTAERIRNATPRELTVAPPRQEKAKPASPGNGGGKGDDGGDTTTWITTGSSWVTEELVKRTTGKAFFVVGGSTYVCSGSVVTDSATEADLLLTAGHCVHDGDGQTWASKWMFVPDYDSAPAAYDSGQAFCAQTRFGCWVADRLVTTTAWANTGDFDGDVGFAVTGAGGHDGASLVSTAVGGSHDITFAESSKTVNTYSFGYPHASPYDGSDLVYCAGSTIADPYGANTRGLECDMTGGSSGGPWYLSDPAGQFFADSPGTAISVNSYKYTRGKYSKHMFGPVFGSDAQAAYGLADGTASTGNAVSTP